MRRASPALPIVLALAASCGAPRAREEPPDVVTLSVVGTNDLHGHVRALPLLAGYLENLRAARAGDGGAVLLIDGGDMFQGTLESNLNEGAAVVAAYEALGYDAVTIGNHEFDYGPVGPDSTARAPGDDPLGALRARIAEADFPFLSANVIRRDTGAHAGLGLPATILERAGVRIGVIGITTEQTMTTTVAANVAELAVRELAATVSEQARELRARGAAVVLVAAHAGGRCAHFDDPDDLASCEPDQEIFEVARALAPGVVDAIVAGHTHQAVAHRVNGIAIVESFSYGVAFGRVDLTIDRRAGRVLEARVRPPQRLCSAEGASPEGEPTACAPLAYEGAPVTPVARIAAVIAPAIASAAELREHPLGVTLAGTFTHSRNQEGPLGNLFTDLMLRARPGTTVALVNGGGLRTDLAAGPLTYGELYEAFPFDNRFAILRMTGAELRAIVEDVAAREGSFFSVAGVTAEVRCEGSAIHAELRDRQGRAIADGDPIVLLSSDFLAAGGDGVLGAAIARDPAGVTIEDDPPLREEVAEEIAALGGTLDPLAYFDPARPRIAYASPRPMRCP